MCIRDSYKRADDKDAALEKFKITFQKQRLWNEVLKIEKNADAQLCLLYTSEVLYMKKSISRIIGVIMLIVAIVFIVFALNHPEMSFPWNNTITWLLYGLYTVSYTHLASTIWAFCASSPDRTRRRWKPKRSTSTSTAPTITAALR